MAMTAQQQLAILLRLGPEYGQRNDGTDAVEFLRDHGPALETLLAAVGADLKRRGYPAGPVLDAYLKLMPYKLTEPK